MLLNEFLLLGAVLFCIGMLGVLIRRNIIAILLSVELMLNAIHQMSGAQALSILSRSFCHSSWVSRATSAALTTSSRPVGCCRTGPRPTRSSH